MAFVESQKSEKVAAVKEKESKTDKIIGRKPKGEIIACK